jgi:hypothetical protein
MGLSQDVLREIRATQKPLSLGGAVGAAGREGELTLTVLSSSGEFAPTLQKGKTSLLDSPAAWCWVEGVAVRPPSMCEVGGCFWIVWYGGGFLTL